MDDDDDDDYMSAAFLADSIPAESLLPPSKRRRLHKQQESEKSMTPTLEQGLTTEIPADNIGYKLLSKMGFQKGGSLGLSNGITEPLPLVLKNDKKGLGKSKAQIKLLNNQEMAQTEIDPSQFRSNISTRLEIKQIKADVKNARNIIEQMDMANNKPQNELWPTRIDQNEDLEESEFDLLIPEMQLKQTMLYLRSVYRYCIYCGCSFDTEEEMDNDCPGESREDHE